MENWYEIVGAIDGMENHPEFKAKIEADCCQEDKSTYTKKHQVHNDTNAWVKNRIHKKRMVRNFLSMNPAMDFSKRSGIRCEEAIYVSPFNSHARSTDNPILEYCINPYTKIFLSPRGDLRKYYGNISYIHGNFTLTTRNKNNSRITNKRIRAIPTDDEVVYPYSYYKKLCGPKIDDLW